MLKKSIFSVFCFFLLTASVSAQEFEDPRIPTVVCTIGNIQKFINDYRKQIDSGGLGIGAVGVYGLVKSQTFSVQLIKHGKEELETFRHTFASPQYASYDLKTFSYRLLVQSKLNGRIDGPNNYARDIVERLEAFFNIDHMAIPSPDRLGLNMLIKIPEISGDVSAIRYQVLKQNEALKLVNSLSAELHSALENSGRIPRDLAQAYQNNLKLIPSHPNAKPGLGWDRSVIQYKMKKILIDRGKFTDSMEQKEKKILEYVQQNKGVGDSLRGNAIDIDNWINNNPNKLRNLIQKEKEIGPEGLREIDLKMKNIFKVGKNVHLEEKEAAALFKKWNVGSKVAIGIGALVIAGILVYDILHDDESKQSMLPETGNMDIHDVIADAEENPKYLENILTYSEEVGCPLPKTSYN